MKYQLNDLLPFGRDFILKSLSDRLRLIKLIIFICEHTKLAIKSFVYHEYQKFDAQVSENLCQIRAYKLQLMTERKNIIIANLMRLLSRINFVLSQCIELINSYEAVRNQRHHPVALELRKSISIETYLENKDLHFQICEDAYFLIQTFILSEYKLVGEHEISQGINYDLLCDSMNMESKSFVKKVIHCFQRNISMMSCQFIFKLLSEIEQEPNRIFLIQSLNYKDEIGRSVIACFEATKIILEHAMKFKKQICMVVTRMFQQHSDHILFFLKYCETVNDFVINNSSSVVENSIVLFKGINRFANETHELKDRYLNRFIENSFYNIILCNMAQHPQYTGVLLDNNKYNPYMLLDLQGKPPTYVKYVKKQEKEFLRYKYCSVEIGCSPENSSLFLLTHVRCTHGKSLEPAENPEITL